MQPATAAYIYAICAAFPVAMQIALALGAPIGQFANGGRFRGRLPTEWRFLAVVQGALLVGMAWVMLSRASVVAGFLPNWLFWATLILTLLTTVANAISPSRPERRLWTPVTAIMSVCALSLAVTSGV